MSSPVSKFEVKGYLESRDYAVILVLVAVPMLMLLARLAALPDSPFTGWPVVGALAAFGGWLDNNVTLAWISPADRHSVVYLLMLPTAGLLITVARLTFGLRVLGLRSILIGVAFHEIGVLPSLLVMALVIGIIVLLRPSMRRMRLPMYARLSLILGITAGIQVLALLVGTWQRSDLIWNLAFFPVIIMAMIAESIAGTLDSDSIASAAWRLGWTLFVAFVLALIMGNPSILGLLLGAPELMLLQLAAIILVAEHGDLRLFQDWQASARQLMHGAALAPRRRRVAVVVNRSAHGTISRHRVEDSGTARRESVQHLVDALRSDGYLVRVFEGDMVLLRELSRFLAPHPRTGAPGGVVLNLSEGIQGRARHCHVPAMLEMAGVAYTGPDPVGHALRSDRSMLLTQLHGAGLRVPSFRRLLSGGDEPPLEFPVRVCSGRDDSSMIVVRSDVELRRLLAQGSGGAAHDMLIEDLPPGEDYHIGLVGNERLECLPVVRLDARGRPQQCPVLLAPAVLERMRDCAFAAFRASHCRDFARVELRVDSQGQVHVLDVKMQGVLGRKSSVSLMVEAAGFGWGELLRRMVELAARRNGVEWIHGLDALAAAPAPDASAANDIRMDVPTLLQGKRA